MFVLGTLADTETFSAEDWEVVLMSSDFAFGALCRFGFGSNFPFTQLEIDLFSFDSILCDSKVKRQDSEECSRGCSRVRPQLSQSTQSSDQSLVKYLVKVSLLLKATKDQIKLNLIYRL